MSALPTQAEWDKIVADFKAYEHRVNTQAAAKPAPTPPKPAPKPVAPVAPKVAHIFGVDLSGYNNPNWAALKSAGVKFVSSQVTDGRSYADRNFRANWEGSRREGIAFGAYHFLRSTSSIDEQLANVAAHIVDKRIPVSIDCEPSGSSRPTLWHVREFIAKAPKYGIKIGFLYLPHFYWVQLGRPSLKGLPPLWQASYGQNPVGSLSAVYSRAGGDHSAGWSQQGYVTPTLFQYGSQVRIPGYSGNLDADAYRGLVGALLHTGRFI